MWKLENHLIEEANEYISDFSDDNFAIEEFEQLARVKNVTDIKVVDVEVPDEVDAAEWEYDETSVAFVATVTVEYTTSTDQKVTKKVPFSFGMYGPIDTYTYKDLEHMLDSLKTRPFYLGFGDMRL